MEMAATGNKLTAAVEDYFAELRRIRATVGGTGELSYYPPLNNLLRRGRLAAAQGALRQPVGAAGCGTSRLRPLRR